MQAILSAAVYPKYEGLDGLEVPVIAQRAGVSTRTVYRALNPKKPYMPLSTADRLLMAVERRLTDVRLVQAEDPDATE